MQWDEDMYQIHRKFELAVRRAAEEYTRAVVNLGPRPPESLADTPPDGRTIIDPPPTPGISNRN